MSEKILNEFAVRLNKSRTQLSDVCNQVDSLRREAHDLQKKLDVANKDKEAQEKEQRELKQRYIASKTENERENERFVKEQTELKNLRKSKIELTKKKELSEKECQKLSNELQQSIQDRQELEALGKKLAAQLQQATEEKDGMMKEYQLNQQAISNCNKELRGLKGELESMKTVIQGTFDDELMTGNQLIQSQMATMQQNVMPYPSDQIENATNNDIFQEAAEHGEEQAK